MCLEGRLFLNSFRSGSVRHFQNRLLEWPGAQEAIRQGLLRKGVRAECSTVSSRSEECFAGGGGQSLRRVA